jgi:hypothetical protein
MKLDAVQREDLMRALAAMPGYLHEQFDSLSAEEARTAGPDEAFAPVEQAWHLADLEREGFAVRIRRLRDEPEPALADFDGARVARQRNYRARSLRAGIEAFANARAANVTALLSLTQEQWLRSGSLEGVGLVTLCDMPVFLLQHDEAHRREIEQWKRSRFTKHSSPES